MPMDAGCQRPMTTSESEWRIVMKSFVAMRIHHTLFALIAISFSLSMGAATPAVSAPACPSGLVWAERWEGDTTCVSVSERNLNRKNRGLQPVGTVAQCRPGLVWAEEWEGDTRCVTVAERDVNRRKRGLN
jgi:hypothetical protein